MHFPPCSYVAHRLQIACRVCVAYKGGSEPGVLNLTTEVTAYNGTTYCVSATWNNTVALDETRFETLYASLLAALH